MLWEAEARGAGSVRRWLSKPTLMQGLPRISISSPSSSSSCQTYATFLAYILQVEISPLVSYVGIVREKYTSLLAVEMSVTNVISK